MSATEWAMVGAIAAVALGALTNLHLRLRTLESAKDRHDGEAAALARIALEKAAQEQALTAKSFLELSERVAAAMPKPKKVDKP